MTGRCCSTTCWSGRQNAPPSPVTAAGFMMRMTPSFAKSVPSSSASRYQARLKPAPLRTQEEEKCLASAKLVGSTLTKDPYGIVIPQGHDVFDKLKVATIETLLDLEFMDQLQERYFPGDPPLHPLHASRAVFLAHPHCVQRHQRRMLSKGTQEPAAPKRWSGNL